MSFTGQEAQDIFQHAVHEDSCPCSFNPFFLLVAASNVFLKLPFKMPFHVIKLSLVPSL